MAEFPTEVIPPGQQLCLSCGLCCSGHILSFAHLQPGEEEKAASLGMQVDYKPEKDDWSFRLPCPLWEERCTIYDSPDKPAVCGTFRCKLLLALDAGTITLTGALAEISTAKERINELDPLVPRTQSPNFLLNLGKSSRLLSDEIDAIMGKVRLLTRIASLFSYFDEHFVTYRLESNKLPGANDEAQEVKPDQAESSM